MSIFRDNKGNIVGRPEDESTRRVARSPNAPKPAGAVAGPDDPTKPASRDGLDPKTRRIAPSKDREKGETADAGMDDPVVGWIVIVEGPGMGRSLMLGYGMNSIGRDSNERVGLAFGDEKISRVHHASITCDPKSLRFYLQHGGGQNLTYVGDTPVLTPTELHGGELVTMGETTLKFVRLCGPDFDWSR